MFPEFQKIIEEISSPHVEFIEKNWKMQLGKNVSIKWTICKIPVYKMMTYKKKKAPLFNANFGLPFLRLFFNDKLKKKETWAGITQKENLLWIMWWKELTLIQYH